MANLRRDRTSRAREPLSSVPSEGAAAAGRAPEEEALSRVRSHDFSDPRSFAAQPLVAELVASVSVMSGLPAEQPLVVARRTAFTSSVAGVCLGSAAYAALTVAAAEGACLLLQSSLSGQAYRLLLATLLGAAALVPPALLLGLVQAVAVGAYPEGAGIRGGLAGVGGWFVGFEQASLARGLARPVAVTATALVLAYLAASVGAETFSSWLPDAFPLGAVPAFGAALLAAGAVLYLTFRVLAGRTLAVLERLSHGTMSARRVVLGAAVALAGGAVAAAVVGGESIEALGGREPVLYLVFLGAQVAFATALATPDEGRGRWIVARLWVIGLVALLPAAHILVWGLSRQPAVRDGLIEETHIVRRLMLLYQGAADDDGDGYAALLGGGDCDDRQAAVHPGVREVPGDGIDQDCDGIDPVPPPEPEPAEPVQPAVVERERPVYNVVFVTVDTLRADRMSVYGYERPTAPRLTRLAEGGTLFRRAWAQGPNTKFSITSFMNGVYFSELKRCDHLWVHIDPSQISFPEAVRDAGYHTAAVPSHRFFQRFNASMDGFEELDTTVFDTLGRNVNWRAAAQLTTDTAIRMLDKLQGGDKPFLLWVHYYDPHSAYLPHKGQPYWGNKPQDLYDGEVLYTDTHVARLLKRLDTPERRADTAWIFNADHGDGLGDHGTMYHGRTLYEGEIRVPLIMRVPGAEPRAVEMPVSNIDLAPTILDLMQIEAPGYYQGRSLLPWVFGDAEEEPGRPVYSEIARDAKRKPQRAWIRWPYKLHVDLDSGRRQLYDLTGDSLERHNLLRDLPDVAARLSVELDAFVAEKLRWREPSGWPGHEQLTVLRN